jgi:hypothetical protein
MIFTYFVDFLCALNTSFIILNILNTFDIIRILFDQLNSDED